MKKILLFMILSLAIFACNQGKTGTEAPDVVSTAAIKTIKLGVEGMSCEGCESTIKEEVGKIDGVTEVIASHVNKFATISFDSTKTNLTALSDVITAAGYEVTGEQPLK